jgi:nucleotide-binding universal stress UspA family protein
VPDTPTSPRRLVFGDDRSSGSDLAWFWINSQPWTGWELVVLTADPPPIGKPMSAEETAPRPVAGEPPRRVFDDPGFASVEFLEARQDPRILLSQDHGATVMVVGPASEGFGPWHLGSTTEWLLSTPSAPVLVARTGRPVRRVLVATDGSAHADAALDAFLGLPLAASAEVTVLTVDDGSPVTGAAEATVTRLSDAGCRATAVQRSGKPHREILGELSPTTDLLVLGTRGVGGLDRLRLGSTASAVVRQAQCSVLVAHAPEGG